MQMFRARSERKGRRNKAAKLTASSPMSHWTWSAWGLEYTCQSEPERLGLACKCMRMSLPIYPAHGEQELTAFVVETHRVYNRASNLFRDDLNWQPPGFPQRPGAAAPRGASTHLYSINDVARQSRQVVVQQTWATEGICLEWKLRPPATSEETPLECRKNMYIPQTEVLPITEILWSALVGLLPSLRHWCEGMKPARGLGFPTAIGSWGFLLPWVLLAATTLFYSCPFGLPAPRSFFNRGWPFYQLWATAEERGKSSVLCEVVGGRVRGLCRLCKAGLDVRGSLLATPHVLEKANVKN